MATRGKKLHVNGSSGKNLFPDEETDIRKEVAALIDDPNEGLNMPNSRLGGSKAKDIIGTGREQMLRDLLRSIKCGIPT